MMDATREDLAVTLFDIEAIKFGEFKLKSGILSPIYIDLRVIIARPKLMKQVAHCLWELSGTRRPAVICGVPYTALPIATVISVDQDLPMLIRRKEAKDYGTRQLVEGQFSQGDRCLVVEDVITTGSSILETAQVLRGVGLVVDEAIVLVDRGQGGRKNLADHGISATSVFTLPTMLTALESRGRVAPDMAVRVRTFLSDHPTQLLPSATQIVPSVTSLPPHLPYEERSRIAKHPTAQRLFSVMAAKRSNLCLAADVTRSADLLALAAQVGPHICMLKLHLDLLQDYDSQLPVTLRRLANEMDFLLFEDRKLSDIGQTALGQTSGGLYRFGEWCDIVTVHALPGPGVLDAVREAGRAAGTQIACFIVAEMSSKGALTTPDYMEQCAAMGAAASDVVIGFISQSAVVRDAPGLVHCTPGVKISGTGDSLGQQYNDPAVVIGRGVCDVIIVGRGITEASDVILAAERYRKAGFSAYEALLTSA